MDFLSFFKRHLSIIIIFALLFGGAGFWYGNNNQSSSAKTTLFLTIATKNSSDPEQAEVAATYFGETVMGWFRNPVFIEEIKNKAGVDHGSLTAFKQERQNMLVEATAATKEDAQALADEGLEKIQLDISRYNRASDNAFTAIDQGRSTVITETLSMTFTLAGILFGIFFALILMGLKEFMKDEIISQEEAERISKTKALDFLSDSWGNNDLTLLSVAIQKYRGIDILAGVDVDTELLAIALGQHHNIFNEEIALVDGDLKQRHLHESLGVSKTIKNFKGHTDASGDGKKVIKTSLLIQNTMDDHLKILPAGKGDRFLMEVFESVAKKMKTLIHTQLPENFDILRINDARLILVVQAGKTKRKNLQRIRELWKGELVLVIVE